MPRLISFAASARASPVAGVKGIASISFENDYSVFGGGSSMQIERPREKQGASLGKAGRRDATELIYAAAREVTLLTGVQNLRLQHS